MVVISYAKSCAYTPRASLHLSQMGFSGKWLFAFWELLGFKAMSERSATCNFQGHCVGRKPPETNDFSFSFKLCLLKYPPRFSTKRDARNSHGFFRLSLPFGGDLGVFTMGYIYIYIWVLWRVALRSDWKMCHFPTRNGASFLGFVAMASSSSRTRLSKGQELSRAFRGIDGCMDGVKCKGNVETTSTPNISCKIRKNICIYRNTRHPLGVNDKERHIFDFFIATGKSIRKRDASVGDKISWTIS